MPRFSGNFSDLQHLTIGRDFCTGDNFRTKYSERQLFPRYSLVALSHARRVLSHVNIRDKQQVTLSKLFVSHHASKFMRSSLFGAYRASSAELRIFFFRCRVLGRSEFRISTLTNSPILRRIKLTGRMCIALHAHNRARWLLLNGEIPGSASVVKSDSGMVTCVRMRC